MSSPAKRLPHDPSSTDTQVRPDFVRVIPTTRANRPPRGGGESQPIVCPFFRGLRLWDNAERRQSNSIK